MRQTAICVALVFSVITGSPLAEAQQTGKVARLGWLVNGSDSPQSPDAKNRNAFLGQLRALGYVEGQNLIIERRYAEGRMERHQAFADELVRLKVDALFAVGDQVIQRVKDATSDIAIVMVACDALATGLISSLAHPGGERHGVTCITSELSVKRADLLHQTVPTLQRLAVLYNPADPHAVLEMKHTREIAEQWKVRLQPLEVRDGDELETRFALMKQEQASALLTIGDNLTLFHRSRIVQLAAKNRLPAMYGFREFVEAGGLAAYAVDLDDMWRRSMVLVDKIFRGAKPGDLPIQQATKFEFVINLKAAKALGLTIPPSLLARADEVIQ